MFQNSALEFFLSRHFDTNCSCFGYFTAFSFTQIYSTRNLHLEQGFPTRGARQHLRVCEIVIQIFVLHYCTVMLSSSCANCSAQSVCNYSMPGARLSVQPEMLLISKKKVNTSNFSRDFKIGPHLGLGHVMNSSYVKIF